MQCRGEAKRAESRTHSTTFEHWSFNATMRQFYTNDEVLDVVVEL